MRNTEKALKVANLILKRDVARQALTPEEEETLRRWTNGEEWHLGEFEKVIASSDQKLQWRRLRRATRETAARRKGMASWRQATALAAGVALAIGLGWWAMSGGEGTDDAAAAAVEPGRSKVILVLEDGRRLSFENRDTVLVTAHADITFSGGEAAYATVGEGIAGGTPGRNTLIVPVGGIFSVILSDGTRVFLNSESRLEYPVSFGGDTREVSLEGEAFFEVEHDASWPFIVHAGGVRARVLGTSFNVFAYGDEPVHKATLVSGRLEVLVAGAPSGVLLRPGMEAAWRPGEGDAETREVDITARSLWRDGIIMLNEDELDVVMRMLARWYDVRVFFDRESLARQHTFTGRIDRNEDLAGVLRTLTLLGGPRFEIRGREVHVY
ncbi:MAG: DUF4974 domain-containing protein [Odoribacteraceae bacterium]|jgi:ferric-dicitrate binding protein FerR (iron transport regulator)|nr:DUF4974 domain-containing protein [Odoribacteraceae bacterium]